LIASISALLMISIPSFAPSASKPHDKVAKREQNPHYTHYNGLRDCSEWRQSYSGTRMQGRHLFGTHLTPTTWRAFDRTTHGNPSRDLSNLGTLSPRPSEPDRPHGTLGRHWNHNERLQYHEMVSWRD
jgi:hypothetical protein